MCMTNTTSIITVIITVIIAQIVSLEISIILTIIITTTIAIVIVGTTFGILSCIPYEPHVTSCSPNKASPEVVLDPLYTRDPV